MAFVRNYYELDVYMMSAKLAATVFELSKTFPREETYSLTDQLRRSSRSIGAQIAEAWGKRNYTRHFVSKLSDATSEIHETHHWLTIASQCKYLENQQASQLIEQYALLERKIYTMIHKADLFTIPTPSR